MPIPKEKSRQKRNPEREKDIFKIRIAIFFDGTGNNAWNTRHQMKTGKSYLSVSYNNDFSNVWRLYDAFDGYKSGAKDVDVWAGFYIEGIGTEFGEKDSVTDLIYGTGGTGIKARVGQAIGKSVAYIEEIVKLKSKQHAELVITFDVLGFSRGAAAARYFIHRVLPNAGHENVIKKILTKKGLSVHSVKALFAGLFDTVSAHDKDRTNDTKELKLDAVKDVSGLAYHICAADEYREIFALTDIRSAVRKGVGREIYLPGAHSDIGGGYKDAQPESTLTMAGYHHPDWLPLRWDKGFLDKQGYIDWNAVKSISGGNPKIWGNQMTRASISNALSFVSLQLMAVQGESQGLDFKLTNLKRAYEIKDPILKAANKKILQHAKAVDKNAKTPIQDWNASGGSGAADLPKGFRAKFCHYSANEADVGNRTRWVNRRRAIRERKVHPG